MEKYDERSCTWLKLQTKLVAAKIMPLPTTPHNKFLQKFYNLAISPYFDLFISVCVGLNTIALCVEYDEAPKMM